MKTAIHASIALMTAILVSSSPVEAKPREHVVVMDNMRYGRVPAGLKVGDTIVWVNKDILAHTATSASGGFDSKLIDAGKSWKFVAKKKGDFDYICSYHPMKGRIRVR